MNKSWFIIYRSSNKSSARGGNSGGLSEGTIVSLEGMSKTKDKLREETRFLTEVNTRYLSNSCIEGYRYAQTLIHYD